MIAVPAQSASRRALSSLLCVSQNRCASRVWPEGMRLGDMH
ncbi:MAG: hypothetical protein E5X44_29580 [Mesorhizobium sp.]|nr:MAG: hypothetical protein E5X44_29580 [Mesorhizobium sp.]